MIMTTVHVIKQNLVLIITLYILLQHEYRPGLSYAYNGIVNTILWYIISCLLLLLMQYSKSCRWVKCVRYRPIHIQQVWGMCWPEKLLNIWRNNEHLVTRRSLGRLTHYLPVSGITAEKVKQCFGCTWHCPNYLLPIPKASKSCNLWHLIP